ncbi:MAG TPA: cupin domain-containing protein, partial [Candidatus Competibacteraceae bacterium]|nr:cupin domain-containing protein [Candidatus Competibacteraceae bacterium]
MQLLGGLSPEQFLRDYWQKQPLLIRAALPGFCDPLSPEELAGLACEPGVEARLVLEKGGKTPWTVRHGPFSEADFLKLPETHWTLLVQDAEKQAPTQLADFLEPFRFIPDWRRDDLMISYAPAHGSVGPHVDDYDVFLLQGLGKRRWQIGAGPTAGDDYLPDSELHILRQFTPAQEWILEPGDMLYLPPRIAHHGIALEPCLTYSIGFRAPGHRELLLDFMEFLSESIDPQARYTDPDLALQDNPGAITATALDDISRLLQSYLHTDPETMARWFGRFSTEPKPNFTVQPESDPWSLAELQTHLQSGGVLERNPSSRFAYIEQAEYTLLFIDGQEFALGPTVVGLAPLLCRQQVFHYAQLQAAWREEAAQALLLD